MPIYEFRCHACDERFDELRSATAPPPDCPRCGAPSAQRVLSSFVAGKPAASTPDYSRVASFPRGAGGGCCGGGCAH